MRRGVLICRAELALSAGRLGGWAAMLAVWLGVGAAGCQSVTTVIGERTLPLYGYEGRWVAALAAEPATCAAAPRAVLTIGRGGFALDPFQSTVVVRGSADQQGQLTGTVSRAGASKQALSIVFVGQTSVDRNGVAVITAALHSGACSWRGDFRRA